MGGAHRTAPNMLAIEPGLTEFSQSGSVCSDSSDELPSSYACCGRIGVAVDALPPPPPPPLRAADAAALVVVHTEAGEDRFDVEAQPVDTAPKIGFLPPIDNGDLDAVMADAAVTPAGRPRGDAS